MCSCRSSMLAAFARHHVKQNRSDMLAVPEAAPPVTRHGWWWMDPLFQQNGDAKKIITALENGLQTNRSVQTWTISTESVIEGKKQPPSHTSTWNCLLLQIRPLQSPLLRCYRWINTWSLSSPLRGFRQIKYSSIFVKRKLPQLRFSLPRLHHIFGFSPTTVAYTLEYVSHLGGFTIYGRAVGG